MSAETTNSTPICRSGLMGTAVLMGLALGAAGHCAGAETDGADAKLRRTVERHFEADSGYQAGDLVAHTDVAELQLYLRKAHGRSPATHPKLLKRCLPDHSFLTQLFHSKRGKPALRQASKEVGGYGPLYELSKSKQGRARLVGAIEKGEISRLVEELKSETASDSAGTGKPRRKRSPRIFTADELATAMAAALAGS